MTGTGGGVGAGVVVMVALPVVVVPVVLGVVVVPVVVGVVVVVPVAPEVVVVVPVVPVPVPAVPVPVTGAGDTVGVCVVHDPVLGVGTGAVVVVPGVVMTSLPWEAGVVPTSPEEGSEVAIVVVSVRPGVVGTTGVVAVVVAVVVVLAAAAAAAVVVVVVTLVTCLDASLCLNRARALGAMFLAGTTTAVTGLPFRAWE